MSSPGISGGFLFSFPPLAFPKAVEECGSTEMRLNVHQFGHRAQCSLVGLLSIEWQSGRKNFSTQPTETRLSSE